MTTIKHFSDDSFTNPLRVALAHLGEIPAVLRSAVDGLRAHDWPPAPCGRKVTSIALPLLSLRWRWSSRFWAR